MGDYFARTKAKEEAFKAINPLWQTTLNEWLNKEDLRVEIPRDVLGCGVIEPGYITFATRKNPVYWVDDYQRKVKELKMALRERGFKGVSIRKEKWSGYSFDIYGRERPAYAIREINFKEFKED